MVQGPPSPVRGARLRLLLGLVVILVAAGYIVTSSLSHSLYYYEVDQVVGQPHLVGKRMRVRGEVAESSHRIRRDSLDDHVFLLAHDGMTITVTYRGVLPERFGDGVGVVATGVLTAGDLLQAEVLTTQCPSRYQGQAPTASGIREDIGSSGPSR